MNGTKIGAVVAAAGLSSRMGAFKPLLPFDGTTVIRRCIANLRDAGASEIVVVTGHRGEELAAHLRGSGVIIAHNDRYEETQMFDSLCIGLRALSRQPSCTMRRTCFFGISFEAMCTVLAVITSS